MNRRVRHDHTVRGVWWEQVPAIAFTPAPRRTKTAAVAIDYAEQAPVDEEEGEILRAVMTQAFDHKPRVLADSIWKSSRLVPPARQNAVAARHRHARAPNRASAPCLWRASRSLRHTNVREACGRRATRGAECQRRLCVRHKLAAQEAG